MLRCSWGVELELRGKYALVVGYLAGDTALTFHRKALAEAEKQEVIRKSMMHRQKWLETNGFYLLHVYDDSAPCDAPKSQGT